MTQGKEDSKRGDDMQQPSLSVISAYGNRVNSLDAFRSQLLWKGTGRWEPGRIRSGGEREAGGGGAGCWSHVRAGGGRRMRGIKF